MKISEQPVRYFAVCALCPFLLFLSYLLYIDNISKKTTAKIITFITIHFFFYELFWILNYKPKEINIFRAVRILNADF